MEPTGTSALAEIEAVEEIESNAAPESDFSYAIISGRVTIHRYLGGESTVVIPETIENLPVWKVKSDFLKDSEATEVIYPENFTVFGGLSDCPGLKTVRFSSPPEQITDPFSRCEGLTEIEIPDGGAYRSIGGIVYTADEKTLVAYPRGRTGSFTVPAHVEAIGGRAFYGSGISSLVLSDSVRTIGEYAFAKTENLTEVTIPPAVRSIGRYAFSESGITELYLPDSVVKCGGDIADPAVLISASYPTEGLKPLLTRKKAVFRDETTLQEAFRKAEKPFADRSGYCYGAIFTDLTGDRFPELLLVSGEYMFPYCFNGSWEEAQADINWAGSFLRLGSFYFCYEEETDAYCYYSEPYDSRFWGGYFVRREESGGEPPLMCQDYIRFTEDGIATGSLSGTEMIDFSRVEIVQTLDFPKMLADQNVDFGETNEKFIFVTDLFAEEPNGELQQSPLNIFGKQAESYPYFESYDPEEPHDG